MAVFRETGFTQSEIPRGTRGVYIICVGIEYPTTCIYIGASNDIYKRIRSSKHPYVIHKNHLVIYKPFVLWRACSNNFVLERFLIKKHQPSLNKMWK